MTDFERVVFREVFIKAKSAQRVPKEFQKILWDKSLSFKDKQQELISRGAICGWLRWKQDFFSHWETTAVIVPLDKRGYLERIPEDDRDLKNAIQAVMAATAGYDGWSCFKMRENLSLSHTGETKLDDKYPFVRFLNIQEVYITQPVLAEYNNALHPTWEIVG